MTENDKQTEERIFEAATEVFEEKGMDGARMQDIANHAGINKALLHYYFRTKNHLFDAVFEKLAEKLFMKFEPLFQENLSLEEKLRFFFREHITFLQENPRLPAFILNEINRNPDRIRKILKRIDARNLWKMLVMQHKDELSRYNITEETIPQIITSIVAISIFPFAAKGILDGIFENLGVDFGQYIEERKKFAAEFVLNAIKK
jgi:TetR/AcrR family transcriptional regulator